MKTDVTEQVDPLAVIDAKIYDLQQERHRLLSEHEAVALRLRQINVMLFSLNGTAKIFGGEDTVDYDQKPRVSVRQTILDQLASAGPSGMHSSDIRLVVMGLDENKTAASVATTLYNLKKQGKIVHGAPGMWHIASE